MNRADFIRALPKAASRLHLERSLEPEMLFDLVQRNGVQIPYRSAVEVRAYPADK